MQDPYVIGAGLRGCPLQKCFVDHINAYSVNEVAINWNAAMTWAAARLDEGGEK
jgi:endoglucanase